MGKRTMASCWRQFDKLCSQFIDETKPRDETRKKLEILTGKANHDEIGNALATLFVKPFLAVPISVEFSMEMENGTIPDWVTKFTPEGDRILVQPLAVFSYIRRIRAIEVTEDDQGDFVHWRHRTFLAEISKLPDIHLLFMLVLQRVAYMLEIAHLEKRGGIVEIAEGESYHTLLWAFKEVENFIRRTSGINARAHYRISWYEAEWITGR